MSKPYGYEIRVVEDWDSRGTEWWIELHGHPLEKPAILDGPFYRYEQAARIAKDICVGLAKAFITL